MDPLMVVTGSLITFAFVYVDNLGILEIPRNLSIFPNVTVKSQEAFLEFDATFLENFGRDTVST